MSKEIKLDEVSDLELSKLLSETYEKFMIEQQNLITIKSEIQRREAKLK